MHFLEGGAQAEAAPQHEVRNGAGGRAGDAAPGMHHHSLQRFSACLDKRRHLFKVLPRQLLLQRGVLRSPDDLHLVCPRTAG